MFDLIMPFLGSIVRHGLTTVGGGILATSIVNSGGDLDTVAGAIVTLVGVVLSVMKAKKAA